MSVSFPPPTGPAAPFDPFGPQQNAPPVAPSDIYAIQSLENVLASIPVNPDPSAPRLSITTYYATVSQSLLENKIQEILAALANPEIFKKLWNFSLEKAEQTKQAVINSYNYNRLQKKLNALDLNGKKADLQAEINSFNTSYSPTATQTQVTNLNSDITAFNTAQAAYQTALTSYQTALGTYQTALSSYNSAVSTWKTALNDFDAGNITAAQLGVAKAAFLANEAAYDVSAAAFTTAKTAFTTANSNFTTAKTNLNSQITTYNNFVSDRDDAVTALNVEISSYNQSLTLATAILNDMNEIRAELGSTALPIPSLIPTTANPLTNFTLPASGSNSLAVSVQASISSVRTQIGQNTPPRSGVEGLIFTTNGIIDAVNTPSLGLTHVPAIGISLSNISTTGTNYPTLSTISATISAVTNPTYTPPSSNDFVTQLVDPLFASLSTYKQSQTRTSNVVQEQADDLTLRLVRPKGGLGGAGGSAAMSTINPSVGLSSSFLERDLSKQVFEAYFNQMGVPLSSPLMDQIGVLFESSRAFTDLSAASFAAGILAGQTSLGAAQGNIPGLAISLGSLQSLNQLIQSGAINQALLNIVNSEASLAVLTPEQRLTLAEGLSREVGASLEKSALANLAKALQTPGLLPQLLALAAGNGNPQLLQSLQGDLLRSNLIAGAISQNQSLTSVDVESIVRDAIAQSQGQDLENAKETIIRNILDQAKMTEEEKKVLDQQVRKAVDQAETILQEDLKKNTELKNNVFKEKLLEGLLKEEIDPNKASTIAGSVVFGSKEDVVNALKGQGLDQGEASRAAALALSTAKLFDGNFNPLGTFLAQQLASPTELAALFKLQVMNQMSPVVGMKRAHEVAEDYGNLIFTSANSITNRLTENERILKGLSNYNSDQKFFEDYKAIADDYINPQLRSGSPLKTGETLLLLGLGGGLSNQGVTSGDTSLGPLANRNKHATDYPGILG